MIKQIAALVVGSLAVTVTMVYDQQAIQYLITAHGWVAQMLEEVFSGGHVGNISRELLALLAVPFCVGVAAAAVYYLIKRQWFPYFMEVVWIIWLIQVSAVITTYAS